MGRKGSNVNLTSVGFGMMTCGLPRTNPNHSVLSSKLVGSQPESRSNPKPSRFYRVNLKRLSSGMTKIVLEEQEDYI
jgi:hypothetical protein